VRKPVCARTVDGKRLELRRLTQKGRQLRE